MGLIFDIGLNNGDDSAYYLQLGHHVVGVEANPLLASECMVRFAEEFQQGRMKVINVGLLAEPGTFTFYRNLVDDGWSSFQAARGKKGEWEEIPIPCVTTQQLIAEHGKPLFMKVDIEGADIQALQTLTPETAPPYVSLELSCETPILETLIELGYNAFKFIDGESYWPNPPIFNHEIGWRLLRNSSFRVSLIRWALYRLPPRFRAKSEWNPPGKYSPTGYPFTRCCSGPFGEDAAGKWMSPKVAVQWLHALLRNYKRSGWESSLWWDVHARHNSYLSHVSPRSPVRMGSVNLS